MPGWVISFNHKVSGVLTDVTTCKLRDAGATFGVRRVSDGTVLVAAGTDLTRDAAGLYSHTVSGLTAGVHYQAYVEWVYAGQTRRVERLFTPSIESSAPCYLTTAEAAALATDLPPAFVSSYLALNGDAAKLACLVAATADVDQVKFQGRRYSAAQALEFPRVAYEAGERHVTDPVARHGFASYSSGQAGDVVWELDNIGAAVVPRNVKLAVLHQANSLASGGDRDDRLDARHDGLQSQSVGGMSESYRPGGVAAVDVLCRRAAGLLDAYRLKQGRLL